MKKRSKFMKIVIIIGKVIIVAALTISLIQNIRLEVDDEYRQRMKKDYPYLNL